MQEHPARGLARGAADGAGRWLCARGQPNASVLLQLTHAAQVHFLLNLWSYGPDAAQHTYYEVAKSS